MLIHMCAHQHIYISILTRHIAIIMYYTHALTCVHACMYECVYTYVAVYSYV